MNKKTITALSVGAVAVIGAAIFGCDGFSFNKEDIRADSATESNRKAGDAKYNDGDYTFYFKNGKNVHGDCDGYNSVPGGKTTIYEYTQAEVINWRNRLQAIGINPEVYRTSNLTKYCWVRFDTDLLYGVGWEGRGVINLLSAPNVDVQTKDGKKFNIYANSIAYAKYGENFTAGFQFTGKQKELIENISKVKNGLFSGYFRPTILFTFWFSHADEDLNDTLKAFEAAGIPRTDIVRIDKQKEFNSILLDAEHINWFAFNL